MLEPGNWQAEYKGFRATVTSNANGGYNYLVLKKDYSPVAQGTAEDGLSALKIALLMMGG